MILLHTLRNNGQSINLLYATYRVVDKTFPFERLSVTHSGRLTHIAPLKRNLFARSPSIKFLKHKIKLVDMSCMAVFMGVSWTWVARHP